MSECTTCGGRGWLIEPDGGQGAARECRCRLSPSGEQLATWLGIPPAIKPEIRVKAPAWGPPDGATMLHLNGAAGSGKSEAAAAMLVRAAKALGSRRRAWWDTTEIVTKEQEYFREGGFIQTLAGLPLLCLDNLGDEPAQENAAGKIDWLVRHRLDYNRWTVITTVLYKSHAEEMYGAGFASRVWGGDRVIVLQLGETDWRKRGA